MSRQILLGLGAFKVLVVVKFCWVYQFFAHAFPVPGNISTILRETGRQVLLNMFLVLDLLLRMLFNALNLLPGIKLPL